MICVININPPNSLQSCYKTNQQQIETRMWADAKCNGHPAESMWRLLLNAEWSNRENNEAKMWNPLKFAGVRQTFFSYSRYMP